MPDGTATAHLYRPKLATVIVEEGYSFDAFRKDFAAALTVAIVALPLSMAIAVASGVSPERGLYTAIIGGFLVSALGGSRYQIGGPAGAFIVVVAATVAQFGLERLAPHRPALGRDAHRDRLAAARRADPLHAACGHDRIHLRDRSDDPGQPAQGPWRVDAAAQEPGHFLPETYCPGEGAADASARPPLPLASARRR